jgi:hypothetical protein
MALSFMVLAAGAALLAGRPNVEIVSPSGKPDVPVARVVGTSPTVQWFKRERWTPVEERALLHTGDRVRTGDAVATLRFPWSSLFIGPGTTVAIVPSIVLTAAIEEGRVEELASGEDIIKLQTEEALVRGNGHVVVRRRQGRTFVSALQGTFDVATGKGTLRLEAGQGTVVEKGERPAPPAPLEGEPPGAAASSDPVYFHEGADVLLRWDSAAAVHHVQVLSLESDEVLYAADVSGRESALRLPLGLFRWRVSSADPDRPEGRPSADRYVCVVAD